MSDPNNFRKKPAFDAPMFLLGNRRLGAFGVVAALFLMLGKQTFAQAETNTSPRVIHGEGKKNRIIFYNDEQPDASPAPSASPAAAPAIPTPPPSVNSPAGVAVPRGREATSLPTATTPAPIPVSESSAAPAPLSTVSTPSASTPTPVIAKPVEPTSAPSAAPSQNISAVTAATPAPSAASSQSISAITAGEPKDVSSSAASTPAPAAPVVKEEPPIAVVKSEAPAPAPAAAPSAPRVVESAPVVAPAAPSTAPAPASEPTSTDVVAAASSANLSPNPASSSHDTPPPPSQSVTINLIHKLVQRGILTKEDAADMITQAEAEAQVAREQAQADMFAIAQVTAARVASDQAVAAANTAPSTEESVRVTYIPEPVKTQIKEEVKLELFDEARTGGGGLKGPQVYLPEWVSRVRPFADMRFRFEGDYYPGNNDNTGAFPNFNAINTGAPFDVSGNQFAPQFNTDQNRNRFRFRARFGAELDLNENITMGLRVATGENSSPVSANQTIGLANQGQGGQFSKYAIWLDRAFLKYQMGEDPNKNMNVLVGRFDNPFFSTNLIYSDELGFDGFAIQAQYEVAEGVVPFLNAGAFAVFNTDLNFSSNQPAKFQSYDKYLYAAQLGVDWKINKQWQAKVSAAYYYYYNIEGQLSTPYTPQSSSDAGDTDNSRPSFAQKGNTYMALRQIIPDASNDFGTINQYQYYGLATPFQDLALTARIDYNGFEPVQVSLIGEFIQNLAFDKGAIDAIAVNNRGALDDTLSDTIGAFEGSPTAWLVELRIGTPALAKRWDWNVNFGYRYIGSDSVVDGFNDSNFGLGGTNMQGFTVGGSLALSSNVWVSLRWFGSDNIAGPSYKMNIIQFDLNAKF